LIGRGRAINLIVITGSIVINLSFK
jgi:hypothetical protein